jgi:hypothetical protein
MKIHTFLLAMIAFLSLNGIGLAQAPHQAGGFVLGTNIAGYQGAVDMKTALPVRYMESLKEVEIKAVEGFKSGLIGYGTCAVPGRIVRIKLKYADSTKKFYDILLERFKKRFGKPVEWRGDPFHVVLSWKWSFVDTENNRISLILQHNTRYEEEKIGNAVKLTMWNLFEDERRCFEKKNPDFIKRSKMKMQVKRENGPMDWNRLIPR